MPIPPDLAFASIRTLGDHLRCGRLTSVELTRFFLKRLARLGPKFNAVVTVTARQAFRQAQRADRELACDNARGPLHGIPFGVKDLLATRGVPTTWGAAPYKARVIDEDATVIVRLREAGAVLAAKLAMVEIAGGMGYRQANASFSGPGLNPWNTSRWSGGSSSGPGSAVAAGLVPFAIGSETWGSIVTPSAFCGITGLRPTYGRVSRHGAMALSWTMDKLGPMARTADDCGLLLGTIAGPDPADPTASDRPYAYCATGLPRSPFRLAVVKGAVDHVQPEVKKNYEASLAVLRRFACIDEIELPDFPYNTVAGTLIDAEMSAAFEGMVTSGDVWELTAPEDRWGTQAAMMIPARDYINAMRIRGRIGRVIDPLFAPYDAVVTPTRATVAYPLGRAFDEYAAGRHSTSIGAAANVAGLPAITLPNGFGENHLPTGLQFTGRAFDENRLIAVANTYQETTNWHRKQPPV